MSPYFPSCLEFCLLRACRWICLVNSLCLLIIIRAHPLSSVQDNLHRCGITKHSPSKPPTCKHLSHSMPPEVTGQWKLVPGVIQKSDSKMQSHNWVTNYLGGKVNPAMSVHVLSFWHPVPVQLLKFSWDNVSKSNND